MISIFILATKIDLGFIIIIILCIHDGKDQKSFCKKCFLNIYFQLISYFMATLSINKRETMFFIKTMYVIVTGVTYKKIPGYIHDSACRLCIVKKLKYFEFVLNIFEFLLVWENAKSWLVNASKLFWIAKPYFLTNIKWGYCQFLFLVFKTFFEKKSFILFWPL